MTPLAGPPGDLVRALVEGSSVVSGVEWHEEIDSTNTRAAAAAARGAPEGYVVVADRQRAGRGRHGRAWLAPTGTSLLASLLVRPGVPAPSLPLLPLLCGLAVAEAVEPFCAGVPVMLKWPNDVLLGGVKAAGILLEAPSVGEVIVGIGVNVDWRGVKRPEGLAATSLSEAAGRSVDRWNVLGAVAEAFSRRYRAWQEGPTAFLDAYRARCATLGQRVRVTRLTRPPLEGLAVAVRDDGALVLWIDDGTRAVVTAGDVEHVRPR
jgi:BirA family biotin operon repressor/biotin-[acetyl-CoA-carboxylase] ligase